MPILGELESFARATLLEPNLLERVIKDEIGSCTLWLDGDDPRTIDFRTSKPDVDQWFDKSESGIITSVSQATASQKPHAVLQALRGRTALLFDVAASQGLAASNAVIGGTTAQTIFAVGARNTGTSRTIFAEDDITDHIDLAVGDSSAFYHVNNVGVLSHSTDTTAAPADGELFVVGFVGLNDTDRTIYLNGGNSGSTSTSNSISTNRTTIVYKHSNGSDVLYFDGYIAEILVFTKALADFERKLLELILGAKYGVTITV